MKVSNRLRWTAVTFSAFLAGFYVAYASGYMSRSTDVYQAGSKAKVLDEALRHSGGSEATTDAWTDFHPDLDIPLRKTSPEQPLANEHPESPPQTWMYSSKAAPISPPTTSKAAPPAEREFMMGSKSAAVFTEGPPPPAVSPLENSSKVAPPSQGQPYRGKGAYQGKGGPW